MMLKKKAQRRKYETVIGLKREQNNSGCCLEG
jgi:hypothetical protein